MTASTRFDRHVLPSNWFGEVGFAESYRSLINWMVQVQPDKQPKPSSIFDTPDEPAKLITLRLGALLLQVDSPFNLRGRFSLQVGLFRPALAVPIPTMRQHWFDHCIDRTRPEYILVRTPHLNQLVPIKKWVTSQPPAVPTFLAEYDPRAKVLRLENDAVLAGEYPVDKTIVLSCPLIPAL